MNGNIFSESRISRIYFRFTAPLVLSLTVTLLYNLADTFFVARTNDVNIVAGVSIGAPIFTLLMAVGNIFGQGGSSLIARLNGKKDHETTARVSSFCFYAALITGVVISAFMLIFKTPIVYMLGADSDTFIHASAYYMWLAIGAPVMIVYFLHSNYLRAEGMSTLSMTGAISGSVLNIILDPILILGLGMGAGGAAIATIISYTFSDIFFLVVVLKKSRILSVDPRKALIGGDHVLQILGVGLSAAIVNVLSSMSVIILNRFLLPYGNEKIAAMGIALRASMIVTYIFTGLTFGSQPIYGYYFGEGNRQKLRELLKFSLTFIIITAAVVAAAVFALARPIMRCFMDNPAIVDPGTVILRLYVSTMPLAACILLFTIICQAFGKTALALVLSVCRQGVVFFAVLFTASRIAGYNGIISSQFFSDIITALIVVFIFFRFLRKEFVP